MFVLRSLRIRCGMERVAGKVEGGGELFLDEKTLWPEGRYVTTHLVVRKVFLAETSADKGPSLLLIFNNQDMHDF